MVQNRYMEQSGDLRRAALLMPLAAGVRSDAVVDRISAAVRLGLMVDGEQLPNETELAAQMNVSTVTLREALQRLRQSGIIETRRGRTGGSFVRLVDELKDSELYERLIARSSTEWRDFGEEHVAIAGRIAWLAARRARPAEIERLRSHIQDLRHARGRGEQQRADSRFHIALAIASQSERLVRAEVRLQAESTELVWLVGQEKLDQNAVCDEHAEMVDAIEREDENEARVLAEKHVQTNARLLARASSAHGIDAAHVALPEAEEA